MVVMALANVCEEFPSSHSLLACFPIDSSQVFMLATPLEMKMQSSKAKPKIENESRHSALFIV